MYFIEVFSVLMYMRMYHGSSFIPIKGCESVQLKKKKKTQIPFRFLFLVRNENELSFFFSFLAIITRELFIFSISRISRHRCTLKEVTCKVDVSLSFWATQRHFRFFFFNIFFHIHHGDFFFPVLPRAHFHAHILPVV